MKIKFIKPFRLYNPIGDDMMMGEGTVETMEKEDYARWLIDNGFAEEVKESGWWKPSDGEEYYLVSYYDGIGAAIFEPESELDCGAISMGNCFKTKAAAGRYRDYLKAVATVRQDEGVLTPAQAAKSYTGYYVCINESSQLRTDIWAFNDEINRMPASMILFDAFEHAQDSLDNHPDEWKIIANYDWSRE